MCQKAKGLRGCSLLTKQKSTKESILVAIACTQLRAGARRHRRMMGFGAAEGNEISKHAYHATLERDVPQQGYCQIYARQHVHLLQGTETQT